jgi:lipoyl(octanoyl) transferase
VRIIDCGRITFRQGLALQEALAVGIARGEADETFLLLEHPAVYTIGRGGLTANIRDSSIYVERINRGGDVTWHGPGQLVGYPLINLAHRGRDLHRWMRFLEELLLDTLQAFGVSGHRRSGALGVWTERGKIGFLGVGVRRWVTMHGFSLNVCPDIESFSKINPCGFVDCPITTMAMESMLPTTVAEVKQYLIMNFGQKLHDCLPMCRKSLTHAA